MPHILISSCLLNIKTQYNEGCENYEELKTLVKEGKAIFACPEQLGGLSTPRPYCTIEHGKTAADVLKGNGRVVNIDGEDRTKEYVQGAKYVLNICKTYGIDTVILKARSPACGSQQVSDGTFSKTKISGKGILAELLSQNGLVIYNEENYPKSILN